MPMTYLSRTAGGQAGFTLLEVLVAMIVLAIGLLGAASLQLYALRGGGEGLQRSQATVLANAVTDRMRSNPERLDSYVAATIGNQTFASTPAQNCSGLSSSACLTARATRDLYELEQLVHASDSLITPRVCTTNTNGTVTVVVAWRGMEKRGDTSATLNSCGSDIEADYRKQIIVSTYIAPCNPYGDDTACKR